MVYEMRQTEEMACRVKQPYLRLGTGPAAGRQHWHLMSFCYQQRSLQRVNSPNGRACMSCLHV